jgi:hypothetical protein
MKKFSFLESFQEYPMKKFFCTGKHSDGSEVVASITDLNTFINASPDEFMKTALWK